MKRITAIALLLFQWQVGNRNFTPPQSTVGGVPATLNGGGSQSRVYMMTPDFAVTGYVYQIKVRCNTAPAAGTVYTVALATDNGSLNYTIVSEPVTLTLAATTALQTFNGGTDFTPFRAVKGQTAGLIVGVVSVVGISSGATVNHYILRSAPPGIGVPTTYSTDTSAIAFQATN